MIGLGRWTDNRQPLIKHKDAFKKKTMGKMQEKPTVGEKKVRKGKGKLAILPKGGSRK